LIYIIPLIWLGTGALAFHTWKYHPEKFQRALQSFKRTAKIFLGVVPLALIAASFLTPLVPSELVGRLIGESAGLSGILIAILLGFCIPVPPPIFFPLIAVLLSAGAGFPQLTALIASWNIFAIHRTLGIELPIMGRYFVTLRVLASLGILPLSGIAAEFLTKWLDF
jgi:uncharacterized membrane protein YraQ (UPF0718 family)